MLLYLLVSTIFAANFSATASYDMDLDQILPRLNGTAYVCPLSTACYSRDMTGSCDENSVCCPANLRYYSGKCIAMTCGRDAICCQKDGWGFSPRSFESLCVSGNVCCPYNTRCSGSGHEFVCVEYEKPEDPAIAIARRKSYLNASIAIFLVLLAVPGALYFHCTKRVSQIILIRSPGIISKILSDNGDFKPKVMVLIRSPQFLEDLKIVHEYFTYLRYANLLTFLPTTIYFLYQLYLLGYFVPHESEFASVAFSILVWSTVFPLACVSARLRYLYNTHLEAIPALIRARQHLSPPNVEVPFRADTETDGV